jgi:peptidoglycan/xylan/chitin deacetylase (PgdA/CDA1 family)
MTVGAYATASAATRRWQPAGGMKASAALHVAAGLAFVLNPSWWPWVLAVIAGNHALLIASVFCPRGRFLGPNIARLPPHSAQRGEVALTFDDGPDPLVTPRVLDLLERYGMKATFFCVGAKVRAHPQLAAEIARRGHAVENHSDTHIHWFAALGPWRISRDIARAQAAIADVTGARPLFFRAPNGFRNPWLDPLLARQGLRYVSWTRRGLDTVRRDAQAVSAALTRDLAAGDVLLMHDGNCGRTTQAEPMVLAVLPVLLEHLRSHGLKSVALRTALETH